MSQLDPIRCLNGFYMGVKVQTVPSDVGRGDPYSWRVARPATRKRLLTERLSRG